MSALWSSPTAQYWTALIGTLFLLYALIKTLTSSWSFFRPSQLHRYNHSNSWACVTGSTDGIGLGFAKELASNGFNVLLHGRNPTKLQKVRSEISQQFPDRKIEIVVADASSYDDSYSIVVDKIKTLPGTLTVLVNNVGGIMSTPQFVAHSEIPHEDIDAIINLNLRFGTHLIRELLPVLRENGPALLANIGSVGGIVGVPYITTYSATKAYVHTLTESLKNEMVAERVEGVDVVGFVVGNVESNSMFTMSFAGKLMIGDACTDFDTSGSQHEQDALHDHVSRVRCFLLASNGGRQQGDGVGALEACRHGECVDHVWDENDEEDAGRGDA
ncbi:uncharacterized protein LTR77_002022 [Saxophila tyrrhenica]|uniref:NAD(P)-binding protein n=1 Tax=Saxophila tyrrhenica TaxID=1690608 RepID=A0AAV9PM86_9PEZI|nr:hypothetical protein LTR77_002022 [Saxophila tyrrhenica]